MLKHSTNLPNGLGGYEIVNPPIINILSQFDFIGSIAESRPFGSGHIHKTFLIRTLEPDAPDYILQKINHHVFPNVELLMNNIGLVTRHIQSKVSGNEQMKVLTMVQTHEGKNYLADEEGNCWRMFHFIAGSRSYDTVPTLNIASEAGKAYGQFIVLLNDLPVQSIKPVISDFHSLRKRFRQFEEALRVDSAKRKPMAEAEIHFIYDWKDEMMQIPALESEGKLPARITHNDTKINNVLFDDLGKAICVIDLDTVMPGLVLYDFGDAIRTAAATAPEDEQDLNKMNLNLKTFKAFTKGFLEKTLTILTPDEIAFIAFSCRYITFIQAMRFLTDYLAGDQYYSTRFEDHNLIRTRAQIRLAQKMKEKAAVMQDIVMRIKDCE